MKKKSKFYINKTIENIYEFLLATLSIDSQTKSVDRRISKKFLKIYIIFYIITFLISFGVLVKWVEWGLPEGT